MYSHKRTNVAKKDYNKLEIYKGFSMRYSNTDRDKGSYGLSHLPILRKKTKTVTIVDSWGFCDFLTIIMTKTVSFPFREVFTYLDLVGCDVRELVK